MSEVEFQPRQGLEIRLQEIKKYEVSFTHTFVIANLYTLYHELLVAKFGLKLKKVGKTARPFRCDLNPIPQDYTVEVTNRFKGLDPDRVPEELWTEVRDIVQEVVIKIIPKRKK